jgi:hypothetical protein
MSHVRRTSDPVDESVMFEMNRELGNAEQREINRRVEHARAARRQAGAEQTSETTEER